MPAFGLDIGTSSIKAVQLEKAGDGFRLLAAGITSTPNSGLSADSEQSILAVAEAVKKLITDTKVTDKNVNISLPESKVFTRILKLPYLTDQEIDSAISWQAESYIPIPLAESTLDYQVLRRVEPEGGKPGRVEVLIVAAPKTLVAKYMKVAENLGLTVSSIQTDIIALARSLAPAGATSVLADLGASYSGIAIVSDGQIFVSHSVPTGGNVLTRAVANSLNVSVEQAEEYKKTYGLSDQLEGKVKTALDPILRVLVDEVKKAIVYFKNEVQQDVQVSSVILSGGTAGLAGLVPYLVEQTGLEVVIGDPFGKVIRDERLSKNFAAYAPLYGIAMGLAFV